MAQRDEECPACEGKGYTETPDDAPVECRECAGEGIVSVEVEDEEAEGVDEDEGSLCSACHGSGEGPADGTRCRECRGWGEVSASSDRERFYSDEGRSSVDDEPYYPFG